MAFQNVIRKYLNYGLGLGLGLAMLSWNSNSVILYCLIVLLLSP